MALKASLGVVTVALVSRLVVVDLVDVSSDPVIIVEDEIVSKKVEEGNMSLDVTGVV